MSSFIEARIGDGEGQGDTPSFSLLSGCTAHQGVFFLVTKLSDSQGSWDRTGHQCCSGFSTGRCQGLLFAGVFVAVQEAGQTAGTKFKEALTLNAPPALACARE